MGALSIVFKAVYTPALLPASKTGGILNEMLEINEFASYILPCIEDICECPLRVEFTPFALIWRIPIQTEHDR